METHTLSYGRGGETSILLGVSLSLSYGLPNLCQLVGCLKSEKTQDGLVRPGRRHSILVAPLLLITTPLPCLPCLPVSMLPSLFLHLSNHLHHFPPTLNPPTLPPPPPPVPWCTSDLHARMTTFCASGPIVDIATAYAMPMEWTFWVISYIRWNYQWKKHFINLKSLVLLSFQTVIAAGISYAFDFKNRFKVDVVGKLDSG